MVVSRSLFVVAPRQRLPTNDQRLLLRGCAFHLLCRFQHFVDRSLHVESLLGNIVVLALHHASEAFYGIGDLYVTAGGARKLFGNEERLREELLDFAGSRDRYFLILAQFVDAQNGDDVLKIFVGLQRLLTICATS